MRIRPTAVTSFVAAFALTACSVDSMLDAAYPDRQRFQVASDSGLEDYVFLCSVGESASATEARVASAAAFADANLDAASAIVAEQMMSDMEEGRSALGTSFRTVSAMDRAAETIVEETEARFECLLIDVVETF